MAEENTTLNTPKEQPATDVKGKGKAVEEKPIQPDNEEMESDDEGEDMEDDEAEEEEEPEDDMEEIDLENIVGRRTRGKKIDFSEEAKKAGNELDEDDEDDDDFIEPIEEEK